jgi:ornithine cyclodeaminase
MNIPYITAQDVSLNWPGVVAALRAGHMSARPEIADQFLHRGADVLLSRAAWINGLGVAVKSVTVFPANVPSVQGAMLLFDDETGAVEAVIDSALVTRWKTVADSILGAQILARPDARRLLVIGAGAVAEGLVAAYPVLFPGLEVEIWNRTAARAVALAARVGARAVRDLPAAVGRADIISVATMSNTPVLKGEWLRAGQHVDLIGAFTADMREADDAALQRSRIFVDSGATTVEHIGELMIPLASGAIARGDILGDLYDLAQGAVGRTAPEDITLFKNGGGAHLDLMVARVILDAYRAQSA